MPRRKPLTREQKLERREQLASRAAAAELRLPDAIREIRLALGFTQVEFAQKFGLSRAQVIKYEKGCANPTQETLGRICKPFGLVLGFVPRKKEPAPAAEPPPPAET